MYNNNSFYSFPPMESLKIPRVSPRTRVNLSVSFAPRNRVGFNGLDFSLLDNMRNDLESNDLRGLEYNQDTISTLF